METFALLRVGRNLLVGLRGDLDDDRVLALEQRLMEEIAEHRLRGLLLDLSGLEIVDSFVARAIHRVAAMARLIGARCVVVGIQPAVAITLVDLGLNLESMETALDAERGLELLNSSGPGT